MSGCGATSTRRALAAACGRRVCRAFDDEAFDRVARFLAARSIEIARDDCQLGEAILVEGDEVLAHGAEHEEAAAGDGYRSSGTRRVLDDADGAPVLVRRAAEFSGG